MACQNAEMTALSLEGWYQEYVAKRAAMGVILNYKEANNTASCLKLTSNLYSLSLISLSLTKLSLISLIFFTVIIDLIFAPFGSRVNVMR